VEFVELVHKRYAARAYDDKKIDDDKISQILEMIRFSPSALNLQPWKIKVIDDDKLKEELYRNSQDQKHIVSCSHLLVFCANTDIRGNADKVIDSMKMTAEMPEGIVQFFEMGVNIFLDRFTPETIISEAQHNVFIAVTHGVYAAKSLGIDSCILQGFDPAAYSEILELPSHIVPTVLVTLGYATDEPIPKIRLPKEDIFI
jgi:nitroreductase/dihydropteridine reductase